MVSLLDLIALLLVVSATFSYLNCRYLKLPTTIGLMLIALVFSLTLVGLGQVFPQIEERAQGFIREIDFNKTVMHGMLGLLLFAGALHVDIKKLAKHKYIVAILATVAVLLSTAIVGGISYFIFQLCGLDVRLIYCFILGALISPTDPIAVLGIMKKVGTPKDLELKIAGESLFNDGVGVVVFLGLVEMATEKNGLDFVRLTGLFFQEAVCGALFGLVIGYVALHMLRQIEDDKVEILITLALAVGGYAAAIALHVSGPIAMVVAGLLLGNGIRNAAMTVEAAKRLDIFWELVDEILNAVLFVLIGLELLIFTFAPSYFYAGLLLIPVVLIARFISVGLPILLMKQRRTFTPGVVKVLTWGGLRGGVSIALALSIPPMLAGEVVSERDVLVACTYIIVVFSIAVQGLTIGRLVRSVVGDIKGVAA